MSTIAKLVRRLIARHSATTRHAGHVDSLSLRDWADLPAHHPQSDPSSF